MRWRRPQQPLLTTVSCTCRCYPRLFPPLPFPAATKRGHPQESPTTFRTSRSEGMVCDCCFNKCLPSVLGPLTARPREGGVNWEAEAAAVCSFSTLPPSSSSSSSFSRRHPTPPRGVVSRVYHHPHPPTHNYGGRPLCWGGKWTLFLVDTSN